MNPESTITYQWKDKFQHPIKHKGINRVQTELDAIKKANGKITPELLLEAAKSSASLFHDYFQWNDKIAANQHRLEEARYLLRHIEIRVVTNGEVKVSRAYEVISHDHKSNEYKKVTDLTPENMNFIIRSMISDLGGIKKKLEFYNFDSAVGYITATMDYLENAKEDETKEVIHNPLEKVA
jgi:hypothetical protein